MSLKRFYTKGKLEAGCDEAGRGCLAGPVVAAAVILPPRVRFSALNDSKQVSLNDRNRLRKEIEKKAVSWGVGIVSPEEIDEINILNASFLAMHRAIDQLSNSPELLLIDGNRFNPYKELDYECIVKGDSKFLSIAAASILAKTHRDEIMENYHENYPVYSFSTHKGYPTKTHRKAIEEHGPCAIHRKSFQLLPRQLKFGFDRQ